MSLYSVQKIIYRLNREPELAHLFLRVPEKVIGDFELTEEERRALIERDIGLLYVLGVNGQLLMHMAATCGIEWSRYLSLMREGVARYGPVRAGIYAMTTRTDEKVAGV